MKKEEKNKKRKKRKKRKSLKEGDKKCIIAFEKIMTWIMNTVLFQLKL